MPPPPLFLAILAVSASAAGAYGGGGATFAFDFHHRYSGKVRDWARSMSWEDGGGWPEEGTLDYYRALVQHDHALLRGRGLAAAGAPTLTFAGGNQTVRISRLGFLHYAEVEIGTPRVKFLVALDTGSDLFWVPCDCQSCAPVSSAEYGINTKFNIYNSNLSTTSKRVPCKSSLCELQSTCSGGSDPCPYIVKYATPNLSSSGILLEDVLYLATEDAQKVSVKAQITFGCGKVQTGAFLRTAAPNGLFGLGMEKLSVPSILASSGLISNSFSMCFARDGTGRISFGDKGSSDQEETPLIHSKSYQTYIVNITGIHVGGSSLSGHLAALFDSGTSFTSLADPAYTLLSESFNSQVQEKRLFLNSSDIFEYCYSIRPDQATIEIPAITLIMNGGKEFPVRPIVIFATPGEYMYCLAIMKSNHVNIIGQNFMSGFRIIFDRERMVLGWKRSNCSDLNDSAIFPINSTRSNALPPSLSPGPNNFTPQATKETGNGTGPPSSHGQSLIPSPSMLGLFLMILLLIL